MIDNYDDLINSSEVIVRLAELEDTTTEELSHDEIAEIVSLRGLARTGENLDGRRYGIVLIRDTYFEDYAREYAEESALSSFDSWPHNYIDWEAAANELQTDYTAIDFDGVTYWARA